MATVNLPMNLKRTGWFYLLLFMENTNICPVWLIRSLEHKPVLRIRFSETVITLTLADCYKDFKKKPAVQ